MSDPATHPAGQPVDPAPAPADPMPLRTRALLLDMDGTLIDSGPAVERSWAQLLPELGSTAEFTHDQHGRPARQVLQELVPHLTGAELEAAHDRIEQLEIENVQDIVTLPGTERLLRELDDATAQLGRPSWTIVTSCTRALFEARWATTGLPAPAHLVTVDQVERGKPAPDPYLLGAERLQVAASDTIVVEDSAGGLRSGQAAGARTIAVTSTTPAAVLSPLADALITSLDDIAITVDGDELVVSRR